MSSPLSLYIHIPFCRSKCAYCDFYSYPSGEAERAAYVEALCGRLHECRGMACGRETDTVYFGGGTPTVLRAEQLCAVLRAAGEYNISEGAEISTEANPGTVDAQSLKVLRRGGFNRVSFGMQSAAERELAAVGRIHRQPDTARAVADARAAGFRNINLDIMLGLPEQTPESLDTTLDAALSLAPEHISAYCLRLEDGTPLAKSKPILPSDDAVADMYLAVCQRLAEAGYEHYEISNFALKGFACRHNLRYWTRGEYLGFGPAAHSFYGGRRFFFPSSTAEFIEWAKPQDEGAVDADEERTMLSLRLASGLPSVTESQNRTLEKYAAYGLAERLQKGWRLTEKGWLVSNTIISELI